MRLPIVIATLAILLSFSILAAANHACWTPVGVGEGTAKDISIAGSGVYIVSQDGSSAVIKACQVGSGCSTAFTISDFQPQVLSVISPTSMHIAGKKTSGTCPGGAAAPCAVVKNFGPGGISELSLKVTGLSASAVAQLNFFRLIETSGQTFLVAAGVNVPVLQLGGGCGADYCGEKMASDVSTATAVSFFSGSLFIGTSSGKLFTTIGLGEGYSLTSPVTGTPINGIAFDGERLYITASNSKAYFSNNDLSNAQWTEIGSAILPASPAYYNDLIAISNPTGRSTALYLVKGQNGETYAFTNQSTARETYPARSGLTNARFVKSGSDIWAYARGTNTVFKFNCGASPTTFSADAPSQVAFGGNFGGDVTNLASGNGAGHSFTYRWSLQPVEFEGVFQTVSRQDGQIDGLGANRSGTYNVNLRGSYNGFPALNYSSPKTLTILQGNQVPAPGAGGTACTADVQCPAGQVCRSGACVAPSIVGSGGTCGGATCNDLQSCVDNACVDSPALGSECSPACAAGQVCSNGACVSQEGAPVASGNEPAPTCSSDDDCAAGQFCNAGSCAAIAGETPSPSPAAAPGAAPAPTSPGPTGGSPGGGGYVATGGSCSANDQCADDAQCDGGSCRQVTCAEGRIPIAHRCVTVCSANEDCEASEACVESVCRALSCQQNRPNVVDHACAGAGDIVMCQGQRHNKNEGACCSNRWVEGQTTCAGIVGLGSGESGLEAVQQIFAPQGNLLPFVAIALLVVILAMGVSVYFLAIKKPPSGGEAVPTTPKGPQRGLLDPGNQQAPVPKTEPMPPEPTQPPAK